MVGTLQVKYTNQTLKKMNKPFYSKRRLKKMGIILGDKKTYVEVRLISHNQSLNQSVNITQKVFKEIEKPIRVIVDGYSCSAASLSFINESSQTVFQSSKGVSV